MFRDYIKYLASETETLEEYLDLKQMGLSEEEIEGYFDFFNHNEECASNERK